jgi:predicted nucleic-acid-binding Zn-ribbon protein
MSEAKKCPKCGGEMEEGETRPLLTLGGFLKPRSILRYVCKNCGYIELYEESQIRHRNMKKEKE